MRSIALTLLILLAAACGTTGTAPATETTSPPATEAGRCADVVEAVARHDGGGSFTFEVTVRSGDSGWDQYADRWEVLGPDGSLLGTRTLTHPHVDEQPFARSQSGIVVPDGVDTVTVRAHDSVGGFCGVEAEVAVTR